MNCLAWNTFPPLAEFVRAISIHPKPLYLIAILPDTQFPNLSAHTPQEQALAEALHKQMRCLQFNSINALEHVLPDVHVWLMPSEHHATGLSPAQFPAPVLWQTESVAPKHIECKPWFTPPANPRPKSVLIIGAGIAGAATARLLAEQGIAVTVLEAQSVAGAASGNRQGLLYAKISPHNTEQTELLMAGYGYTRRLLDRLLPEADCWGGKGVLHLNYDESERSRNHALGNQHHHAHLYHSVSAQEASEIAGITLHSDGLYWPQGVWLNPPALVDALLHHPLIDVREHTPLLAAAYDGTVWLAHTPCGDFNATHIVYCMGAHSPYAADKNIAALPYRQIRGQTGVADATAFSSQLQCALSAESYISPAWQNRHCYGATFVLNSNDEQWHMHEEQQNRHALQQLHSALAQSLFPLSDGINALKLAGGHAALRCDSPDHLPMSGALGDIATMQQVYAKLALDKNYRLPHACPYLPNAYLNTAHGTRGLATAPICAASLVAEMLGLPNPLSPRIRMALHPNRAIIRAIIRHQPL